MNFFCILDKDISLGFELLGLEVATVLNKEEALSIFESVILNKDIGIIIISQKIASLIKDRIDEHILSQKLPFIVEIPDRDSSSAKKAVEFLKGIIGFGA